MARDGMIAMLDQCPCRKRRWARRESAGDSSYKLWLQVIAVVWWKEQCAKVFPLVIVWMENDPTVWWLLRPSSYFWFVRTEFSD